MKSWEFKLKLTEIRVVKNKMIFNIDSPEEFKKFAQSCDPDRYRLYWIKVKQTYMLRPTKSSKHLDTALYSGESNKDLTEYLEKRFAKLTVSEVSFFRE